MTEVPDVADCLEGWKALAWDGPTGQLYSGYGGWGQSWPLREPVRAVCPRDRRPPCEATPAFVEHGPSYGVEAYRTCSGTGFGCGIYAFHTLAGLLLGHAFCPCCVSRTVIVRLEMGGRFIAHARGLRAEYAMVTGIVDPTCDEVRYARDRPGLDGDFVGIAAARYDVPILDRDLAIAQWGWVALRDDLYQFTLNDPTDPRS